MAASGVPVIGSEISLTTKTLIRYTGTLYHIDINESTVALKDVRSFGTEDRPTHRFIPPSPDTYEYITFRGPEITDLHVIATTAFATPPQPIVIAVAVARQDEDVTEAEGIDEAAEEEAVAEAEEGMVHLSFRNGETQVEAKGSGMSTGLRNGATAGRVKRWGPPPSATPSSLAATHAAAVLTSASRGGRGGAVSDGSLWNVASSSGRAATAPANGVRAGKGHGGRSRQRTEREGGNDCGRPSGKESWKRDMNAASRVVPEEAFDFDAMNAKFDKASLASAIGIVDSGAIVRSGNSSGLDGGDTGGVGVAACQGAEEDTAVIEVKYNKAASFFDELKAPEREYVTHAERTQRRNADFETFGETHSGQHQFYYRGRGRGGYGRGGRAGRTSGDDRGRRAGRGYSGYGGGGYGSQNHSAGGNQLGQHGGQQQAG